MGENESNEESKEVKLVKNEVKLVKNEEKLEPKEKEMFSQYQFMK